MQLRPYQKKTIDDIYLYLQNDTGNPCVVLPTGAGKSVVIAELCRDALTNWPRTKILMLVHTRELIQQNADKLMAMWPNAPLAIYSAGLGVKETDAITYAGIQSARGKAEIFGHVDLCLVDECHLISHKEEGSYRALINDLKNINSNMRVIGFTATPYRLGHGKIIDGDALFDQLIEPVTIEELQRDGYLARLRSRVTSEKLLTDGVHKRGGEYIESELQKAVDTEFLNKSVVTEIIEHGKDKKHWLIFCTGVEHSYHIRDELLSNMISAAAVTGETPLHERDNIIDNFKRGKIRAITNAQVLTTGFDFPDIDLIVMLRPTMSPTLYVQMAGRGLRLKSHTDHCLVLDFAGVVKQHGPITMVQAPEKNGEGGIAPVKDCPECMEIVHASVKICPECLYEFPPEPKPEPTLHDDDIQGNGIFEVEVIDWEWAVRSSKAGNKMIVISYYIGIGEKINEYLLPWNEGYVGKKSLATISQIADSSGCLVIPENVTEMKKYNFPKKLLYKMDGKYHRIVNRVWEQDDDEIPF